MSTLRWLSWLFFRFDGRLRRLPYILGLLAALALLAAPVVFYLLKDNESELGWILALFVIFLPTLFSLWALTTKRLHDMGVSGVYVILLMLPYIQVLALIGIMLVPGTGHANRFGRRAGHFG